MSRPANLNPGFVGEFSRFRFSRRRGTVLVAVGIPRDELDLFLRRVGSPPSKAERENDDAFPLVLMLPCPRAQHWQREKEAKAEAAISFLLGMIDDPDPVTPALAQHYDALRDSLDRLKRTFPRLAAPSEPDA